MHTFLSAIALASLLVQSAVPPVSGSGWQRVQAVPVGTSINVTAATSHGKCKLKSVDADTLTCTQRKDLVFQRADIRTVKVYRRGRSTLIGTAIGGAAGAVAGFAIAGCAAGQGCLVNRPTGAVIFGIPGAGIGALIGFFSNSAKSTVYTAP